MRLCGLGCVTFFANVLGPFSFPLAFLKVPLRPLGNVRFLLCLSPDLDGVQLFRIHCHAAAVVRLCLHTGTLFCSSIGVPKMSLRPLGNDRFLLCLSLDLDGVPLFRIHCQAAAVVRLCGLGCVTFFANDWCFFLFL